LPDSLHNPDISETASVVYYSSICFELTEPSSALKVLLRCTV